METNVLGKQKDEAQTLPEIISPASVWTSPYMG